MAVEAAVAVEVEVEVALRSTGKAAKMAMKVVTGDEGGAPPRFKFNRQHNRAVMILARVGCSIRYLPAMEGSESAGLGSAGPGPGPGPEPGPGPPWPG